jgi:polyisoprenoid-binding protein YceI
MAVTTVEIPGYLAGTWTIDPAHTDISFTVRHMMVSKVRGHFRTFEGEIVTATDPLASSATLSVDLASLDTNNAQRDDHIRSADFFEVETYPTMTYRTTGVRAERGDFVVDGELTLHGVTRPVALEVEINGFRKDPFGGTRTGFSAKGEINRKDFGIDIDLPMDGGGVVVGDKVAITLEVEAVLNTPEA